MGRRVKRVRLDFDWPMHETWPGYFLDICDYFDDGCEKCRRFARLAGVGLTTYNCPEIRIEPLEGPGWQMWEAVTEGSPISPVCDSAESLAHWLADNKVGASGGMTATQEEWLARIRAMREERKIGDGTDDPR